jgi:hypothetical protein
MSSTPTPLVPYNPVYADIYTDVERSIQQTLKAELVRRTWPYPIFVNQVDEKEYKNQVAAISIMKVSDVPDYTAGGGQGAVIRTPDGNSQKWPKWFNLLYQIRVTTQTGVDLRNLDGLIRYIFPPRGGVLWLWNSTTNAFTKSYCTYEYAGYINRDNPQFNMYDRITNMRFEVPSYAFPAAPENKITQIVVDDSSLDFEVSVGSGS